MKRVLWPLVFASFTVVSFSTVAMPADSTGRFQNAADVRAKPLRTKSLAQYCHWPLSVEMWVKLPADKMSRYNLLAANLPGSQRGNWEIYTTPLNGLLTAVVNDEHQGRHHSYIRITDGRWHFIVMTCDGKRLSLAVDGKATGTTDLESKNQEAQPVDGELFVGTEFDVQPPTARDGWVDELRISSTIRPHEIVPTVPLAVDEHTVALWRFDETEATPRRDASPHGNALVYSPGIEAAWTPRSSTRPDAEGWEKETDADWTDDRFNQMDKGTFLGCSMTVPSGSKGVENAYASKGLAIRVGDQGEATVLFDRSRLQMCAAWQGGFVHVPDRRFGLIQHPEPVGQVVFATPRQPGWQAPPPDRRSEKELRRWAPLPNEWGRYEGLYRNGKQTVLQYSVNGRVKVRETPWVERIQGKPAITRTISVSQPGRSELRVPVRMRVLEHPSARLETHSGVNVAVVDHEKEILAVASIALSEKVLLEVKDSVVSVSFDADPQLTAAKLIYWRGPKEKLANFARHVSKLKPVSPQRTRDELKIDFGLAMWKDGIVTDLLRERRTGSKPFAVDTLSLPHENPYGSILYVTGIGFLPDERIAICTIYGDVWLVSRHPQDALKLRWKRFASGLYQPLGLVVRGGNIFVLERGQITQLWDNNADGEADLYENFCNRWETPGSGHAYDTGLKLAPDGSMFFFKGQASGDCWESGCLVQVSKDGSFHQVYATGFRHPIGLGIGPKGQVTGADQQGNWMPATRVDWYKKDGFYGDMRTHHRPTQPSNFDLPICWLPTDVDNSAGGQVWVPEEHWGPLGGKLIHLSWGRCRPFLLLHEKVDDQIQGGVVPLPVEPFRSGPITGVFHPSNGHLLVVGLHGWQTAGKEDGCLHRIRYTARTIYLPISLEAHKDGIRLGFDHQLAEQAAAPGNFIVQRWNYKYSAAYGSDHWSLEDPSRMGHDRVPLESVELEQGGKVVFLKIADMRPTMQMRVAYTLPFHDGHVERNTLNHTVHRLRSK